MLVAEKRMLEDEGFVAVSSDKKAKDQFVKQNQSGTPLQLTETRAGYEATGNGTPVYLPTLSAEASQPTPFTSLTWEQWLEMREQISRSLERFVSAAEEQRADKVLSAGLEIQAAISHIFLEAYAMSADLDLKELPH